MPLVTDGIKVGHSEPSLKIMKIAICAASVTRFVKQVALALNMLPLGAFCKIRPCILNNYYITSKNIVPTTLVPILAKCVSEHVQ